ncbi:MAG: hypothetical protein WCI00_00990 [bacterium]
MSNASQATTNSGQRRRYTSLRIILRICHMPVVSKREVVAGVVVAGVITHCA